MSNAFDINAVILEVQAEFAETVQEFIEELAEPQARRMLAMQWAQMPPDQKEAIRQANPEAFEQLSTYLGLGE